MIRFLISILLVVVPLVAGATDKEVTDSLDLNSYIMGGVVGSVVGFGIGHGIQKRYTKSRAWIFTAGETLAVMYIFSSGFFACDGMRGAELDSCSDRLHKKFVTGSIVYWGFHLWERFLMFGQALMSDNTKSVLGLQYLTQELLAFL